MTKGKDIYDIGKEDGRKERENEIIEIIDKISYTIWDTWDESNGVTLNKFKRKLIKQIKQKGSDRK